MKLLVQWARKNPGDWEEIDSSHWVFLPKKPDRTGRPDNDGIDDVPGYINQINIQGLTPVGDHYVVEDVDAETIRLTVWNDDYRYVTPGERHAVVWTIKTLAPDPTFGGAINTRQSPVIYAEGPAFDRFVSGGWTDVRPWSEFILPQESVTKHGRWYSLDEYEKSKKATRLVGWREFTDGLPASEIVDGKVPVQRRKVTGAKKDARYQIPLGTKTSYASNTASANGIHVATNEYALLVGTGVAANLSVSAGKGASGLGWCFTSPANWPNDADWPSGDYRYQIDVTANGYSSLGLRACGTATGHFARVNSALSSDQQSWAQAEAAFTGTGLKLATTGTIDPTSGAASDRFECLVAWTNASTKNDTVTIQVNETDDYADGPWAGSLAFTVSDTAIEVSDSVVAQRIAPVIQRTISDTAIDVTDSVLRRVDTNRRFDETSIDVSDAFSLSLEYSRAVDSDATVISDLVAAEKFETGVLFERDASDSIDLSDVVTRSSLFSVTRSDTIEVSDTVVRSAITAITLSDTIEVVDVVVRAQTANRSILDTVEFVDLSKTLLDILLTINEFIETSDLVARSTDFSRGVADSIEQTDQSAATVGIFRIILQDAMQVSDVISIQSANSYSTSIQESVELTDVIQRSATFEVTIDDWRGRSTP